MINLDFRGSIDQMELAHAMLRKWPWLQGHVWIHKDENGRNYIELNMDEMTKDVLKKFIEDFLLSRNIDLEEKTETEKPQSQEVKKMGKFTFFDGAKLEQELGAEIDVARKAIQSDALKFKSEAEKILTGLAPLVNSHQQKIDALEKTVSAQAKQIQDLQAENTTLKTWKANAAAKIKALGADFPA